MKKVLCTLLVLGVVLSLVGCGILQKDDGKKELTSFYDKVKESQSLLDDVADTIYGNWYDCIYKDDFSEDINVAIAYALVEHEEDLDRIEVLDAEIAELFKTVKNDEENGRLVKEIMSAYSDYYEFVVNVSGSFNSFSESKETLKKELASLLKDLSYEL